ncbi:hypothetical protein RBH26_21150 [Natronolimnohabitans sp. A-GB9]|uniref:hypothetical protein n=1 Tax=Natronolimnohabitans sp. A-GB9 TaxID=3069757 RepID=UPI0027AE645D|nr:hypothetical protein [Natronolimnohabitans sp. A-GB9]MDQ2052953.1 hypothetical protein [Natronolimnohabitans sp. A-GB9]
MSQEQEAMKEEYRQRVDDLVTTLEELSEVDVPEVSPNDIDDDTRWDDASIPAANAWQEAVEIVEEHIGGVGDFSSGVKMPTSTKENQPVTQCVAPEWLGDYIHIGVLYYPTGELGVRSSVILYKGGCDVGELTFFDGRLHHLDSETLNELREVAYKRGPFADIE